MVITPAGKKAEALLIVLQTAPASCLLQACRPGCELLPWKWTPVWFTPAALTYAQALGPQEAILCSEGILKLMIKPVKVYASKNSRDRLCVHTTHSNPILPTPRT